MIWTKIWLESPFFEQPKGFSLNLSKKAKTNYIVIDSFNMPVDFYEFVKNEYGVNNKRIINSIPIRIAVENE